MRLGKGLLSAIKRGGQGAGPLAVTLGAAMGLSGMGAIPRFAQDVELRIAGRSDNYEALTGVGSRGNPLFRSDILGSGNFEARIGFRPSLDVPPY